MAEQAEIPEVDSPFGKRVAVTIAIVAVVMAIISNRGDDAKTDALLKTTQSANKWGLLSGEKHQGAGVSSFWVKPENVQVDPANSHTELPK